MSTLMSHLAAVDSDTSDSDDENAKPISTAIVGLDNVLVDAANTVPPVEEFYPHHHHNTQVDTIRHHSYTHTQLQYPHQNSQHSSHSQAQTQISNMSVLKQQMSERRVDPPSIIPIIPHSDMNEEQLKFERRRKKREKERQRILNMSQEDRDKMYAKKRENEVNRIKNMDKEKYREIIKKKVELQKRRRKEQKNLQSNGSIMIGDEIKVKKSRTEPNPIPTVHVIAPQISQVSQVIVPQNNPQNISSVQQGSLYR
jgi:hypothetical protein